MLAETNRIRTVLEQRDEVGLGGFLESHDGRRLETEVRLVVLGNLTDETLERELADQKLGRFLGATVSTPASRCKPDVLTW
jgi:hypothetical protein